MGRYLIQILVLLYFVGVVIECAVHEKRDVHHRIIIKDSRPRRVARPGKEHHYHPRHSHKKEKRHKHHKESAEQSYEEESEERHNQNYSPESSNSYEEVYRKKKGSSKPRKHRGHSHKSKNSHKDDSRESNKFKSYREDPKYRNEWRPLSSETSVLMDQIFRENTQNSRYKKQKKDKKHHHGKHNMNTGYFPYDIDMTTVYPSYTPYQFDSTIYPPLSPFPTYNQKIFEANQPPLIGTIEQFKPDYALLEDKSKKLVSPVNNQVFEDPKAAQPYQVHEAASNIVEVKVKAAEPASSVPAEGQPKNEPKKEPLKIEKKIPTRGRIRMRAKPKTA